MGSLIAVAALMLAIGQAGKAATAPAPAGAKRYRHPSLEFSLELPPGWTPAETGIALSARFDGPGCTEGDLPVRECREFMVVFRGITSKENDTTETFFRERMERNRRAAAAWTILEEGRMTVGRESLPWARMDFAVAGSAVPPRRLFSMYVVRGRRFYELTGEAAPESFARWEPVFRRIFATLELE
jgi:hypothetical protein